MLNPHEKNEFVRLLKKVADFVETFPTTTACADCKFHNAGACRKWGETIPAETLPTGCDEWIFDEFSPPF